MASTVATPGVAEVLEKLGMRKEAPLEDDFVSSLLAARANGEALPDELIIGCVRQVLVVGIIAPTVMIGSIAVHLARHPFDLIDHRHAPKHTKGV